MSQDLKRGYGRRLVYVDSELYIVGKYLNALDTAEPEHVVFLDSDRHIFYNAVKINSDSDGTKWDMYQTSKLTYGTIYQQGHPNHTPFNSIGQDLLNGYNISGYFNSDSDVYEVGHLFSTQSSLLVRDSEGPRFWVKTSEPGNQASNYARHINVVRPQANIRSAELKAALKNQQNRNFNPYLSGQKVISLLGENFVVTAPTEETQIKHGLFLNGVVPLLQYKVNGVGVTIPNKISFTTTTVGSNSTGTFYNKAINLDSEKFIIGVDADTVAENSSVRYITQMHDSELQVVDAVYVDSEEVKVPKTLYADSDFVDTSFTTWDGDEEPWKVFNDSDNNGFKASLGVESGHIGIKYSGSGTAFSYVPKRIEIINTPATLAPNRPYDFDIRVWDEELSTHKIIESVRGFDGYTYVKEWSADSEHIGQGISVNFLNCQPDFDSNVNSLEVKQINITASKRRLNIERSSKGFFVDTTNQTYVFTLYDSETVSGVFVGGGGGGGGGIAGGGGSGASSVVFTNLKLNPGSYSITTGSGGNGGGAFTGIRAKNTQDGTNGTDTVLRDVTNNRDIIRSLGGNGGDDAQETSANNYSFSSSTTGPTPIVDTVNYVFESTNLYTGATGGAGAQSSGGAGSNGINGADITATYYSSDTDTNIITDTFSSSGGGAGFAGGADGNGGVNAGDAVIGDTAIDGYGGGGGGAGFDGGGWRGATAGGDGYAFIVFK